MRPSLENDKLASTNTILVITLGFIILYYFTKWEWTLYVSMAVGLAGLISGYLRDKIHYLWMKLAWVLSLIVPNIILSIIFYLFLFPIALLSRIFGEKNPLQLKNDDDSMYKEHDSIFNQDSFEKMW